MTDCQLYLILPDLPDQNFDWLAETLATHPAAALVAAVRLAATNALRATAAIRRLGAPLQSLGIAVLLTDLADIAAAQDCDGAEISPDTLATTTARASLGETLQLGVACGLSRDAAMQAGEDGADYVAFAGAPDGVTPLVAWWIDVMELPAVAVIDDVADAKALAQAGADFIACPLSGDREAAIAQLDALAAAIAV